MDKKICLMTALLISLISSCSKQSKQDYTEKQEYDYEDIADKSIRWENILEQTENDYLVYIYSKRCYYCQQIKEEILEFSLEDIFPLYFVEFSNEIPVSSNAIESIGLDNYENISIYGTPTLLEIESKILVQNIAGVSAIRNALKDFH